MTRCYESYCYFKKNPHRCKSDRMLQRINQYIAFMESKGVKFSGKPDDRGRFEVLKKKYGSERALTQASHVTCKDEVCTSNLMEICPMNPTKCWYNKHNRAEYCPLNPAGYIHNPRFKEILENCTPGGAKALLNFLDKE